MLTRQKNTFLPGLLAALMALLIGFSTSASAALPIESWTAQSGAKVLFMRAEALPMLDVRVDFPAGSRVDPKGKEGLADSTANLIGRGAEGLSENDIADGFADTGALFSGGAGGDSAGFQLRVLTSEPEFSKAIGLMKIVLQKPVFNADVLARENARSVASLKESLTQPDTLAERAFAQALYPNHPYGALVTEASLSSTSLQDVQQFYNKRYLGNKAVVSLVGNVTRQQAEQLANDLTAGLPKGELEGNPLGGTDFQDLQAAMKGQTIQIDHPAAQSHVLMGLPAMRRGAPDYFDLLVANHILGGGGFVSRLMDEIREKRGLAYSAYSYFMPAGDAGPFQAGLQTKKESTTEAVGLLRKTILNYIEKGPTEAELKAAKQNLIGGFPLRIDSNSKLIGNISMMGLHNMPLNYLDTWTTEISQVTVKSAREAFARHVSPEKLVTVVVGGQVEP
jgi:zinc protease